MEKLNRRVYLRVTNKCNKQCDFCVYKGDPKPVGSMTLDTAKSIISNELLLHDETKYLRVDLTGGEPTICENIKELVQYLVSEPLVKLALETNGTSFKEQNFLDIVDCFKDKHFLKISINSALLDSDVEWAQNLVDFITFAKENNIRYVLNVRVSDELDEKKIKQFIEENNLQPDFGEVLYYPIHSLNLYQDGTLLDTGIPFILYDYDGVEIFNTQN